MKKVLMYRGQSGDLFESEADARKDDALCRFFEAYEGLTSQVDGFSGMHELTTEELHFISEGMEMMTEMLTSPNSEQEEEEVSGAAPPEFVHLMDKLSAVFGIPGPGDGSCVCGKCKH